MTDIAFKRISLLVIRKRAVIPVNFGNLATLHKQYRIQSFKYPASRAIVFGSLTSPIRLYQYRSISLPVLFTSISTASQTRLDTILSSLALPTLSTTPCEIWYSLSHVSLPCSVLYLTHYQHELPYSKEIWKKRDEKKWKPAFTVLWSTHAGKPALP